MSIPDQAETLEATAKRNLRHFIKGAAFKCGVDRDAALNCLDVLEDALNRPTITPADGLVERLRAQARITSQASKMMADAKTARQTDRDDYPGAGYSWLAPEQTLEWKAADEIERLASLRSTPPAAGEGDAETYLRRVLDANSDAHVTVPEALLRNVLDRLATRSADVERAETFASIIQWGDEVFGPASVERIIERAGEEWQEMLEPSADIPIEAADVIIVLLRIPGIAEAIQRKMAINRARKWSLKGDGTGYHVPALTGQPVTKGEEG